MIKRVIALMVFCLFPAMANAQYKGETIQIPMVDEGLLWDSNITLEATLYKPEGDGPFAYSGEVEHLFRLNVNT
ncbi:hypothetical protein ACQKP8_19805 [Photobacterium alginatilyticum]|uniref:hypothetical protein n=1 Tax=Photobacterium alginatilyticum TaxID=1775171 RepID=UPI0040695851